MATNVLSVSIPQDLAQFLDENPTVSPSKVLQVKLSEMKDSVNQSNVRIKALDIRNARLSAKLSKILEWCEDNKVVIPDNVLD